ncbi:TIR domain-containing protein [Leucothrix arctica]|uniref:nSTAND1 domain-containing NTPase n=1 Tax=Leucothrix arctica TaxID=1481894 RepID=UPI001304E255|nr:TIR domain-containing protein [Leucothrix arctica]
MLKVFLSHSSADKPLVEKLALQLRKEGFDPWLDKWDLIPGEKWQEGLEQALKTSDVCLIFIGNHGEGPWHQAEMRVALDRSITQQGLRVIPVLLPDAPEDAIAKLPPFLQAYNGVRFHGSVEETNTYSRLVAGIRNEKPGSGDNTDNLENPYRGLQYFDIEHAPFFFGRGEVTQLLLRHIQPVDKLISPCEEFEPRFLAIIGASGSGKSSLARAGLLAALQNSALPDSNDWPQLVFKPGEKPLQSLAVAINAHLSLKSRWDTRELIEKFHKEPLQLHDLGLEWLHGDDSRYLVILADQFEEVFTLCHDEKERQSLLNNLLSAAAESTGRIIVVLTLRADFYANCSAYPQLSRCLESQQYLLNTMNEDELREAIVLPTRRMGCELEAGLIQVILQDVKQQPSSLPLLQYALMQLWEQRKSRTLRLEDYQQFGGLVGALEQRANQIYEGFSPEFQKQCRLIFRRLVQPGAGTEDTRRRSKLEEFEGQDDSQWVIQTLTDARLLTTQRKDGLAFVEVSHEALIRGWSQLREWIDEDREQLRLQHQVSSATQDWVKHGEKNSWLFTGSRLAVAEEWLSSGICAANDLEQRFIAASLDLRDTEKREELRKQKQLKWLAVTMAVFAVVMFAATFFAVQSERKAQQAKAEVEKSIKIANFNLSKALEEKALSALANSKNMSDTDSLRSAILYTLGAENLEIPKNKVAIRPSVFSELSLMSSDSLEPQRFTTDSANLGEAVDALAYSPDGKTLASPGEDDSINLWDAQNGEHIKVLKGHSSIVTALIYSPNGKTLASGSWDETVRLWDAKTGEVIKVLKGHSDWVMTLAYSPDGKVLASAGKDKTVRLWEVASGKEIKIIKGHTERIKTLEYHPNGEMLASAGEDKAVHLWDASSGESLKILTNHGSEIHVLKYSPNGKVLASGSQDGAVRLWDATSGKEMKTLIGHVSNVYALTYSPNGKVLLSAGEDKTMRFWDVTNGELLKTLQVNGASLATLVYSPNGKVFASGSWDNKLRLWDATSREELKTIQGHQASVFAMAYNPNGKVLASGGEDKTVRLWSTTTGEELNVFKGHSKEVLGLSYSPSGKTLASASKDKTIRLWDVATGEVLKTLIGHKSGVHAVAYNPDGSMLASAGDSLVRL